MSIRLFLLVVTVPFFLTGCVSQPVFCPEIKVSFCPVK